MTKVVEAPKMKVYQAKKKEGDLSLFSNLNPNVDKNTQTVSKKKLIKGILHAVGFGGSKIGSPIQNLDANINIKSVLDKKMFAETSVNGMLMHKYNSNYIN